MEVNPKEIEQRLLVTQNPDGTYTRPIEIYPIIPPSITDPSSPSLSKDIPLNSEKSTWVRIFLPRQSLNSSSSSDKKKLNVIIYVHGGGFVIASAGYPNYNDFCSYAASQLGALVVSVDYRLAPENRLPAAYDDVLEALIWVKEERDEWIKEYGDLSSCVLMGDSAGGNIVYHTGLMVADKVDEFKPLIVKGLILIQPYFGGLDRTESELRLENDSILPLSGNDFCWDLSLPIGANRSHEYCDPLKGGGSKLLDRVRDLGWRVWVVSSDGDPLFDRSVELVKLLEMRGLSVKSKFSEGGKHGCFVGDPIKYKADELVNIVNEFFLLKD